MLKTILSLFIIQTVLEYVNSYDVTYRKNVTIPAGTYFYLNHTYTKEESGNIIDYIKTTTTNVTINLTYPYDNTPFDIFVLNEDDFKCYLLIQNSSTTGAVNNCSQSFLYSPQKSYLLTTGLNNTITLYSDDVDDLQTNTYIIVIDNTLFPKALQLDNYYYGAFQHMDINVDICIKSSYYLSSLYYQVFLALLCLVILITSALMIFFIVYYYKYKVLQKKSNKLKKVIQSDSY